MYIFIYKIENPAGNVYIGKTKNIKCRFRQYSKYVSKITQPKLQYSILKYGWINHSVSIIDVCNEVSANEREVFWIKYFDCYHYNNKNGLNLTLGGDGGKGSRKRGSGLKVKQGDENGELIKIWGSVNEAASSVGCSVNSIYAAIKGEKQVKCMGYLWAYDGCDFKKREYLTKDKNLLQLRSLKMKEKYKNGEIVNSQLGKIGSLNKSSIKVLWVESGKVFESVRLACKYFNKYGIINKKEKTISELILRSARGFRRKKDTNFNFKFV